MWYNLVKIGGCKVKKVYVIFSCGIVLLLVVILTMSVSINNLKKSVNKKCEEIKCDYEQNEVSKCNCEQINQSQELDDEIVIKYEGKRYNKLEKNKEVNDENIDKFIKKISKEFTLLIFLYKLLHSFFFFSR